MPVLRPVRSAPPAASRLAAILRRIAGGGLADLPVDVELWDGSVLPAGASGGSAGRIRVGRRALAYLLRRAQPARAEPGLRGGRARLRRGPVGAPRRARALPRPSARRPATSALATARRRATAGPAARAAARPCRDRGAAPRGRLHSLGARPRRDPPPLRRLQRLLPPAARPDARLLVRLLRRPGRLARGRPGAQARPDLPQAAPARRASGCSTSAAAGARCCIHAARDYGVRGVGVTLSEPQAAARARARSRAAGLADRIEIRVGDYRELADGPFDKIASVGMYEHVGRGELAPTRARVHAAAAPGRAVPQPRHRAPALRAAAGRQRFLDALRLPRRRAAPGRPTSIDAMEAPASRSATSSRCASTTR